MGKFTTDEVPFPDSDISVEFMLVLFLLSIVGEVLELVLVMLMSSVWTTASLVFLRGSLCSSESGNAQAGKVLLSICGISSSRILLQVALPEPGEESILGTLFSSFFEVLWPVFPSTRDHGRLM